MTMSRRELLVLPVVLAVAPEQASAETSVAPKPVREFYAVLLRIMEAGQDTPFFNRYTILAPAVDRSFDLQGILRLSVGDYWPGLPSSQRQALFSVFRTFTIASYVSNFDTYDGGAVNISPTTRTVGAEQIVSTMIAQSCCDPLRIDYVMREESTGWKIVDVLLDGSISRAAVQRSDFTSLMTTGNANRLIATLKRKVSDLSGGTIGT
jgi:phospholipid transport system substrate-binding protein